MHASVRYNAPRGEKLMMRVPVRAILLLLFVSGLVSCGGGPTPTVRQQTGKATPDKPAPPAQAPIETVEVEVLEPLFPPIAGWQRSPIEGQKSMENVGVTEAHAEYTRGPSKVEATITDSGLNKSYIAAFTLFVADGYKKETPTGYERAVKVGDYPAWERWDSAAKNGELNVLVGGRFIMQLDGVDIEDTNILHELLRKFDLKKIGEAK
jgi:hypothetical protein